MEYLSVDRASVLWMKILSLSHVDPDGDFFELGGDSLLAVRLIRLVDDECGPGASIINVFENPTPRAFANAVNGVRTNGRRKDEAQ